MNYQGSEWRKWDLHIHSPSTIMNNQFKGDDLNDKWNKYIDTVESLNDIKVLGITDYFSIDGYNKMMEFKNAGRLKNINLLLPNVELRLSPLTGKAKSINFHVIFSPDVVKHLDSLFFSQLNFEMGGNKYSCVKSELIRLGRDFNQDSKLDESNAYRIGVNQFKVNVNKVCEILEKNELLRNNSLTVVANSNQDGVSGLQQQSGNQAERKNIYLKSDIIFSANPNDREFFIGKKTSEKMVISECGSLKPCIHGSDAHSLEKVCKPDNNRFTWIKADTTFQGLKQIIYEPEYRVYIGEEPPLFNRVRQEPEYFLEILAISNIDSYDGKEGVWFKDIEIPLNKELVAIIGNKGKGKSAIADIIGLLGNSKNELYFNFLRKDKFKKDKGKKSKNFEATLSRTNLPKIIKNLDDNIDETNIEIVKYIPQSFFESITNNLDESFEKEVNNVIFSHIKEGDVYIDFDDMMNKKTSAINENITTLISEISNINDNIIKLEEKSNPVYLQKLNSQLSEKYAILNSINKPVEVAAPLNDNQDNKTKNRLDELNNELSRLNKKIEDLSIEKTTLLKEQIEVVSIFDRLESLEKYIDNFILDNKNKYEELGFQINDVINYSINKINIIHSLALIEDRLRNINPLLIEVDSNIPMDKVKVNKLNLNYQKRITEEKIKAVSQKLDEPSRLYQQYLEALNKWEKKTKEITGTIESVDSIRYLENEIEYVKKRLTQDIFQERMNRISKCCKVFNEKEKIINIYNKIKEAIDAFITENNDNLKEFRISLESGYKVNESFFNDFISYIDGTKKGSFRGNNRELLIDLFNSEIKEFKDVEENLSSIINYLEYDQRENQGKGKRIISEQVLKDKNKQFYNFLYSLDYIVPSYSLKLDNKTLSEISPGEKGALLLVFYLLLDRSKMPLVIDQPEDNLDNQSIFNILVPFIKKAKSTRQIIMVTHNPNLAVVADAEQIIYVDIDKKNDNIFRCVSGSIENSEINKEIVRILEGTLPAFVHRDMKYQR